MTFLTQWNYKFKFENRFICFLLQILAWWLSELNPLQTLEHSSHTEWCSRIPFKPPLSVFIFKHNIREKPEPPRPTYHSPPRNIRLSLSFMSFTPIQEPSSPWPAYHAQSLLSVPRYSFFSLHPSKIQLVSHPLLSNILFFPSFMHAQTTQGEFTKFWTLTKYRIQAPLHNDEPLCGLWPQYTLLDHFAAFGLFIN